MKFCWVVVQWCTCPSAAVLSQADCRCLPISVVGRVVVWWQARQRTRRMKYALINIINYSSLDYIGPLQYPFSLPDRIPLTLPECDWIMDGGDHLQDLLGACCWGRLVMVRTVLPLPSNSLNSQLPQGKLLGVWSLRLAMAWSTSSPSSMCPLQPLFTQSWKGSSKARVQVWLVPWALTVRAPRTDLQVPQELGTKRAVQKSPGLTTLVLKSSSTLPSLIFQPTTSRLLSVSFLISTWCSPQLLQLLPWVTYREQKQKLVLLWWPKVLDWFTQELLIFLLQLLTYLSYRANGQQGVRGQRGGWGRRRQWGGVTEREDNEKSLLMSALWGYQRLVETCGAEEE